MNLAFFYVGKVQESEIIEVMPFIRISAIWGQYPVFSYLESLSAHCREWLQPDDSQVTQVFSFLSALRAQVFTFGQPESLMTEILVY